MDEGQPVVGVQRDARSPARFCVGALNHVSIERPLWVDCVEKLLLEVAVMV